MADTNEIDALLNRTLEDVGQLLKLDHLEYVDVDADAGHMTPRSRWAPNAPHVQKIPRGVDLSPRFRWLVERVLTGEPLIVHDLDELPESAVAERHFCEENGLNSLIFLPALLDGKVVGAIGIDGRLEAPIFDDQKIQRLQLVATSIASAIVRNAAIEESREALRFEEALAEISTAFVNLAPHKVDDRIEAGLKHVANALSANFAALLQLAEGSGYLVTHEWSNRVDEGQPFKGISVQDHFPWLSQRFANGEVVAIESLADFPDEARVEREMTERQAYEAVLWVPFEIREELAGYLSISTRKPRQWQAQVVKRLRLLGEVFGEALKRRDAELKLRESYDEIRLLKDKLEEENVYLRKEAGLSYTQGRIIGDSATLHSMMASAEQVAATKSTVLITGETGTGKELLANWIHSASPRGDNLMVKVNCAALPTSLVEAELFGREKGAFTGAMTREPGRFEMADGATLFLDEVGELPLELQAKLLRVLQDGEFERLGSSTTRKVDVRVIVATNRDLNAAVAKREFREDLFYRLNVFPIEVPPLRKRISDLPQLVWSFVQEFSESMGKTIEKIPRETFEALMAYSWPGNVRELRNVVERAMIVSRGPTLRVERLENAPPVSVGAHTKLVDLEREHIETIVESTGWRISGNGGAAEILGLKPTTLEARMKKLGIIRPQRH